MEKKGKFPITEKVFNLDELLAKQNYLSNIKKNDNNRNSFVIIPLNTNPVDKKEKVDKSNNEKMQIKSMRNHVEHRKPEHLSFNKIEKVKINLLIRSLHLQTRFDHQTITSKFLILEIIKNLSRILII